MASSVQTSDDECLTSSDSADEIYHPVVLKTLKSGNDMITSIVCGKNKQFGYFALVCYSNQQLAMFSHSGDFLKNVAFNGLLMKDGKCHIRDMQSHGQLIILTTKDVNKVSYLHSYNCLLDKSELSDDCVVLCDKSRKDTTGHIITGFCHLHSEQHDDEIYLGLAVCCVDELSYDITSKSRRYVQEVTLTISHSTHNESNVDEETPNRRLTDPGKIMPIEFKEKTMLENWISPTSERETIKERYFTFPKRIVLDNSRNIWVIDRKSPSSGDIKVFHTDFLKYFFFSRKVNYVLKFVYSGGPGSNFDPMDIKPIHDAMVISDCSNHNVQLIKNDGTFLMHVMTGGQGLQHPRSLCVDDFDRIWIGCNDGTVHILKYRSEFEA